MITKKRKVFLDDGDYSYYSVELYDDSTKKWSSLYSFLEEGGEIDLDGLEEVDSVTSKEQNLLNEQAKYD